jgi:septum formation protein
MRLLLASKSQTRQRMLEAAGVPFDHVPAELDEEEAKQGLLATGFEPRDLAEMLAEMKARSAGFREAALVLGADQVLEREDGSLLSKPSSPDALVEQLRSLSGRLHYLHSAAVVFEGGERTWGQTETVALRMRRLSDRFIRDYVAREYDAVRWIVGGYRIEGPGVQLFEAVEGSHFAILGLPLLRLLDFLRERGVLQS